MKRALYLAGTFAAAVLLRSGGSSAEFQEEPPVVVPVPANPLSVHSNQQQLHQPSPHNRHLFHQSSPTYLNNNYQRHLADGSKSSFHNIVLLLCFSDHTDRTLPSQADISKLYNSITPTINSDIAPTGSVRQVYLENSYGQFTIETTVSKWITLPHPEEYYAAGNHGFTMLKEGIVFALNQLEADPSFSYSKFDLDKDGNLDGLGVLTSGYGAEFAGTDCHGTQNNYRIWSHKGSGLNWSSNERHGKDDDPINVNRYYVSSALRGKCGSDIVRMGVICHELGHYLGLPDLYDPNFVGVGIGAYDFMSQSWGFSGTGLHPPFLSAWSKAKVGWANIVNITKDGTYDIEASWKSNIVYKLSAGFPVGEYLLIENRQPHSYDGELPNGVGGLAIWHVDDKAKAGQHNPGWPLMEETRTGFFPENEYHYQVALLASDGKYDLEVGANQGDDGDLWSASSTRTELTPGPNVFPNTDTYQGGIIEPTGIKIFNLSASGEKMTFSVEGLKTDEEAGDPASDGTIDINDAFSQAQAATLSTPKPTSNAPTTTQPTSKPSSSKPTSNPTMHPTSSPTTSRPTTSPTSESALCADRCLTPIDEIECPQDRDLVSLAKCSSVDVSVGSHCEADGECSTDEYLNNCAGYDVYRRVDCASPEMTSNTDTIGELTSIGEMTNWLTPVTLNNDPIEEASSEIPIETEPTNDVVLITGSGNIDSSTTTADNGEDCPYYPGIGHSYCLRDCNQPDYMVGNSIFEFDSIHGCCQLHFDDDEKDSCISKTLLVMNSEESDVKPLPIVRGRVWFDEDANDRKGRKEAGVNDVLIDLYDCETKEWVESQRTQDNGYYKFALLLEGNYYLHINVGEDYALAGYNQRRNGKLDSDFKPSDGTTACFPIQPGGRNIRMDAGLVPSAAQLVSAQQQVTFVSIKPRSEQKPAATVSSYATHSKSSQRVGSLQQYKAPPTLHSKSMLRGSNVAMADSFIMNMKPVTALSIQSNQDISFEGGDTILRVGPQEDVLLKFDLSSLESRNYKDAKSARLRLYAVNASPTGGLVHMASHNGWDEDNVHWTNAPLAGDVLAVIGNISPDRWIDVDVTEALTLSINGVFSLRITSENSNHTWLAKFQGISASNAPMLQVTF